MEGKHEPLWAGSQAHGSSREAWQRLGLAEPFDQSGGWPIDHENKCIDELESKIKTESTLTLIMDYELG